MLRLSLVAVFLFTLLISACSGSSDSDGFFTVPAPKTYTISGSLIPGTETSLENVTVTVYGPVTKSVATDIAGSFAIDGLLPGIYTVATTRPESVFEPARQEVVLEDRDVVGLIFEALVPEEGLSVEEAEFLASAPARSFPENQVILPNGMNLEEYLILRGITIDEAVSAGSSSKGVSSPFSSAMAVDPLPDAEGPQQRKNDIVSKLLAQARYFSCGQNDPRCTTWDYSAESDDPETIDVDESVTMPAHEGLTYIWGGKDPNVRTLPQDGCPELTHGLDCSGLLHQIAVGVGISLPVGTSVTQADPASWVIPEDWQLEMKLVTDGSSQSGDIVAGPGHSGIAESAEADSNVISAVGVPNQCAVNIGGERGPKSLPMSSMVTSLGEVTSRLRLVTTLSGTFDMPIKCVDQTTDAGVLRFEINNDDGGPFEAEGEGIDYDGDLLCFNLSGNYDQISNEVSAVLSLCDETRKDSFTVTLLQDGTDYFPLEKVVDNGGCFAEARLIRIQDRATTGSASTLPTIEKSRESGGSLIGGPTQQQ